MRKDVAKRIMALMLSVCMIAGMINLSGFTVYAASTLQDATVEFQDDGFVYDGTQKMPTVTKISTPKGDLPLSDYDVTYGENINAGPGTIIVTNKSDETDTITETFTIAQRDIAQCNIADIGEQILRQEGVAVTPALTVTDPAITDMETSTDKKLTDKDYTVTYSNNTTAGEATATIYGRGNYTGNKSANFNIVKYEAQNLTFEIASGENIQPYNKKNEVKAPVVNVKYLTKDLVEGQDYEVKYRNNTLATTEAEVWIEGKNDYAGLVTEPKKYTIYKMINDGRYGAGMDITVDPVKDQPYAGGDPVKLTTTNEDGETISLITVRDPDSGKVLEYGTDYVFLENTYSHNTEETTDTMASVQISGVDDSAYRGRKTVSYKIVAAELRPDMVSVVPDPDIPGACIYDGSTNQYNNLKITVTNGSVVYVKDRDYAVEPVGSSSIDAGTYQVKISPKGSLKGKDVIKEYTVAPRDLSDSNVTVALADGADDTYTYTGRPHTPGMKITYRKGDGSDYTLLPGKDYLNVLNYEDNTNAGTAKVSATGTNNFTGNSGQVTFTISPIDLSDGNTTITGIPDTQVYTGSEIRPQPNVTVTGRGTLNNGTDYDVAYTDNTTCGTATVTITAKGNYRGTFQKSFAIVQRDLNDGVSIGVDPTVPYTGQQVCPEVKASYGGVALNENVDYKLTYGDNIKKGTGTVTIDGIGNFKGTVTKTFIISARNLNTGTLAITDSNGFDYINGTADDRVYSFDGTEKKPTLTVEFTFNNEAGLPMTVTMIEGQDFDLKFSNNTEIGTAKISLQAKDNYAGSTNLEFKIKGNLADYGTVGGYTKVTIPEQIYTSIEIIPTNETVTFNGKELTQGKDYTIAATDNVVAGSQARATITGMGDYFGTTQEIPFAIRPLNLATDDLTENNYVIGNVLEKYTYSGLPINPVPEITHTGTLLTNGTDYSVNYNPDGVDNINVGTGKFVITGELPNYEGEHAVEFDIEKYDIGAGHEAGFVQIQDLVENVIWEEAQAGTAEGVEMVDDKILQKNLKVHYTPVNLDGTPNESEARELDPDTEYKVSYEKNNEIGTATITITGKGDNFTGEIKQEFRIRGDLSKEGAQMEVEDWTYTPPKDGVSTNTPEPVVTYTITYQSGRKETKTLEKDKDYTVVWSENENATLDGTPAKVTISPVFEEDGVTVAGDYIGNKEGTFQILQRDLSKAIEQNGVEKDPLLDVTGLLEGYEYTGSPIVPEVQVSCTGTDLSWVFETEKDSENYDYEISAKNNTNVYEYDEQGGRLKPTVKVSARKDADGNFVGNYKGDFEMEFNITPREISEATVDTIEPVAGVSATMDYTGDAITFPLDPENPKADENAIDVTWSKDYEDGREVRDRLTENKDYKITYRDNTKIGNAAVLISAVEGSNYTGTYEKAFKIMASIEEVDKPNPVYMTLDYDADVPFGAKAVYPKLQFKDISGVMCGEASEPKILEEGVDYEIVTIDNKGDAEDFSRNNVNVASKDAANEAERPTVVVRGLDCYRGIVKRYYNIIPKDLAADQGDITAVFEGSLNDENYENAYEYTGNEIKPNIQVYNGDQLMEPGRDYRITGYVNNTEISTATKKAGVIIEAVEGGNYVNSKTLYFNIIARPLEKMTLEIKGGAQVFDRKAKEPEVEVYFMQGTNKVLLTKDDYDVAYENNTNASNGSGENAPAVVITGKGFYGGTLRKTFAIEPESMKEDNDDFVIKAANAVYSGEPVTTTIEVKAKDGTLLVEGEDYQIGAYKDNVKAGTGYVTIQGINNYKDTRQVPFYIIPIDAGGDFQIDEIPAQAYCGKAITPEVTVKLAGTDVVLRKGVDYEVTYSNNINAGTATVTIVGAGNFSGTSTAHFTITRKSIGTASGIAANMVLKEIADQQYTGRGVTPDVSLSFQNPAEKVDSTLVLNRDYKLTYTSNVAVGTATVIITGINNYDGSIQSTFRILGPMKLADVAKISMQQYTGKPVTPSPKVTFAGKKLVKDTDYTLAYKNNVERGTASVIITGKGWYTGSKTVTFEIARDFSKIATIKGVASAYTYTGKAIKPAIRVEDGKTVLTKGKDYKVSYSNNTNAGKATITVTGINNYRGSKKVTFKIKPQRLGRATVSKIPNQTYNGKEIKPKLKVKNGSVTLKSGTDFKPVYVNSKNPGKAKVIIKGKGNYTGTQTVSYSIVVPKVTGVKVAKYTDNSITFSWKKNSVVSGYEIYNSKNKRLARVTKKNITSATVAKLKAASMGTYRVRAFVIKTGRHFGPFTSIKASTGPKATKITSLASPKSKQVVVKWKKIKGATQYQVYRSTSKKGKYSKIATTKKTSYTDKKAKGGKKYYYMIRVGQKNKLGTYYSRYSSVKSIAARK